ncbi:hypothetical protein PCANC_07131 [Puccinia coronata f. sp. avenae]|uniref:Uncharacterized protein n=1 Tax=Puccinia coronata f. sp. avenae TaxID=200324 RepID=A0A2N5TUU5_9BASI|nr:hypothetical protein PCANC_15767 [Puccinia coronata f. sp. avenae]PLW49873.1 hypothetical protein PCANC_07131 [Puccinia coronata f. sp. avenae]
MDHPNDNQFNSFHLPCPSSLGFTPLRSSYTDPDFDQYNQVNYDEQHLHNQHATQNQYEHATQNQYGAISHMDASLTSAQHSANPQVSLPPASHMTHMSSSTGVPGISGYPNKQNNFPNQSIPFPPTGQPALSNMSAPISYHQPPQKRLKRSRQPRVIATPSTVAVQSSHPPENTNAITPPIEFNDNSDAPPIKKQAPRSKMPAHLVEDARRKTLDELIELVCRELKYVRLTAKIQLQLNAAYMEYQRQLYIIAYENKLEIEAGLQYVGQLANTRISTNYNNYCRYDPEASKIYKDKSIDPNTQNRECGRLWKLLDSETHAKWKDPAFLERFQSNVTNGINDSTNQTNDDKHKPQAKTSFNTNTWANKVVADLRNLSQRKGVEGVLIVGTRSKEKFSAFNGGSQLGERFLDMFSTENNPCQLFINFITGHRVVKSLTGKEPPPITAKTKGPKPQEVITEHNKGGKLNNITFICDKINTAIDEAAPGRFSRGWPGTNTQEKLKANGVSLAVCRNNLNVTALDFCMRPGDMQDNHLQRVVAALEEHWVELRVESTKIVETVGFDIAKTQQENLKRISVGRCQSKSTSNNKRKRSQAVVDDEDMDSTQNNDDKGSMHNSNRDGVDLEDEA